ncbi:phytoene desaturase family protein [Rugosimonospora africana]|uniref:Dehydrogenase n=1 Tax=Rugosimonospora africana TaxID=556532 RepID=A0A8J3QT32_9ACTN|nr:NAD(P)/FAD-dependent oxidoreductase [Rugosimonospora africana]GIH16474.1 dehydrogenase [Rugosimonospora africana]
MADSVDAVVIGSGPNGLVAANLLADAGWDVLVLESAATEGGGVRTAELTAPGFRNDVCSAFYPFATGPSPIARLGLAEHGLRWEHAPAVLAHVCADRPAAVLSRDPTRTAESVDRFAAGDGQRWLDLYRDWQRVAADVLRVMFTPFPPVRAAGALVRRTGTARALRLARRFVLPVGQLGAEEFTGDGARLLLAGCALHTDVGPADAAGGGYGWLLAMLGQQYGFPVPRGGAQALTAALVHRLRGRGGEVHCGAHAERIVVGHGRALGVGTRDGHWYRARRAVLADVAAGALYLDLVPPDALPDRLLADAHRIRMDAATVKVDWALSGPVPWRDPAVASAGTVHLGADLAGLHRYAADLGAGSVPEEPFMICGQLSTCDPSRSPAGTESLWTYTHVPHRESWPASAVNDVVARMEAQLERYAPGFGGTVLARHVAGPEDLEAENPNLVGGALGGGTAAVSQQLFLRPVPGLGRADTPVDRLYLASASAHPGPGVHGGPGANAARAALARDRFGAVYAAAIRAANRLAYG